jgi:heterodisulfide reductase subunit C
MKKQRAFTHEGAAEVPEVYRCYQCLTCTLGCPVAFAMDLYPHEIVKYVQLGARDKVLNSSALWTCASCETCATRCPNEIEIVQLMDCLRRMAIAEKRAREKGPILNRVFLDAIRKRGRIHEISLIVDLKRKTGELFRLDKDEMRLGLAMLRRGKLKLLPTRIKETNVMKRLFSHVEKKR